MHGSMNVKWLSEFAGFEELRAFSYGPPKLGLCCEYSTRYGLMPHYGRSQKYFSYLLSQYYEIHHDNSQSRTGLGESV